MRIVRLEENHQLTTSVLFLQRQRDMVRLEVVRHQTIYSLVVIARGEVGLMTWKSS